jgi:hypothetical protein
MSGKERKKFREKRKQKYKIKEGISRETENK